MKMLLLHQLGDMMQTSASMSYETFHIACRVRESRIARNLSQRDLSKLSGVPQAQASKVQISFNPKKS